MRTLLFILICSFEIFSRGAYGQKHVDKNRLYSQFARTDNRIEYKKKIDSLIAAAFNKPLTQDSEETWEEAFKYAEINFVRNRLVYNAIVTGFKDYKSRSIGFVNSLMLAAKALYPGDFEENVMDLMMSTDTPVHFAYAAEYLLDHKNEINRAEEQLDLLMSKFPLWKSDPVLMNLQYRLTSELSRNRDPLPPLKTLLSHEFQSGKTIIFSFYREDRNFPGLSIIRDPDGTFATNSDGSIFSVRQLAVSASGYPGYLKGGNTPQGVLSIVGWYITPTEEIGPTPIILTRMPFEKPTSTFYHNGQSSSRWIVEDYRNLLPVSWRDYFPVYEAYYAGMTGRRLIVMHGSADDISNYESKPYYPLTPTRGCISSKEIWDPETGKCIESDQAKLMNAFFSTGETKGFLVVINIDDKQAPVTLDDLLPHLPRGFLE